MSNTTTRTLQHEIPGADVGFIIDTEHLPMDTPVISAAGPCPTDVVSVRRYGHICDGVARGGTIYAQICDHEIRMWGVDDA